MDVTLVEHANGMATVLRQGTGIAIISPQQGRILLKLAALDRRIRRDMLPALLGFNLSDVAYLRSLTEEELFAVLRRPFPGERKPLTAAQRASLSRSVRRLREYRLIQKGGAELALDPCGHMVGDYLLANIQRHGSFLRG